MLALTENAVAAIKALVESSELGQAAGLRIGTSEIDDPGAIELSLVEGPSEGDRIVAADGASVFVEASVGDALGDATLDAVLDEDGVHFGLLSPNEHDHHHDHGHEHPGHGHDHHHDHGPEHRGHSHDHR